MAVIFLRQSTSRPLAYPVSDIVGQSGARTRRAHRPYFSRELVKEQVSPSSTMYGHVGLRVVFVVIR